MTTANTFTKNITNLCFLFLLVSSAAFAQVPKQILEKKQLIEEKPSVARVEMSVERGTPSTIQFDLNHSPYQMRDVRTLLKESLALRPSTDRLEFQKKTNHLEDIEFARYQQYYKDIKVEHGQYVAMTKGAKLAALNGEYYEINDLKTTPTISEEQALKSALAFIGAEEYVWDYIDFNYNLKVLAPEISAKIEAELEEYTPEGELVIVDDYDTHEVDLDLAYKFNIYANSPVSRDWVYVNAHTGKVMLKNAIIKHAQASVQTRYNGVKTIETTEILGANPSPEYPFDQDYFILKDETRGNGIQTYDMNGIGGAPISVAVLYSLATDFVDDDNIWTTGEHVRDPAPTVEEAINDDIAWDAHWGAEMVYDYWKIRHNRDSYDDNDAKINSYVHYGEGYDNAFWNGSAMTYGDGSFKDLGGGVYNGSFAPLTSMDVCAHEIGHAVCTHTADLVYQRESGAMNEGFSDIWAACVENFVMETFSNETFDYKTWGIGEQIDNRQGPNNLNKALRWMDDPKEAGDPDTYGGANWTNPECGEPTLANDYCGVHSNSGVLNKWFYLLTEGSGNAPDDGVNDNGQSYSVSGLGFAKAELIAFGTEVQLGPNATFAEARAASITYARSVYGPCSAEEEAVTNAWYAVGVGGAYGCESVIATGFLATEETVNESADGTGFCDDSKTHVINVFVNSPVNYNVTIGGTATLGVDYTVSTTNIAHNSSFFSTKQITISIIDDAAEEGNETIVFTIPSGAGGAVGSDVYTLNIRDDDVNPTIGIGQKSLLYERFLSTSMPAGWGQVAALSSGNAWYFGSYAGKAYISFTGVVPNYEGNNNQTDIILHTPLIDARGMTNVLVSFDWEAGGETDAAISNAAPFDYGSLTYSFDGVNFFDLDAVFVGENFGATVASGSYSANLSDLFANQQFYLGFRWQNDPLVGTAFSFSIDNVRVNAQTRQVESDLNDSGEEYIGPNETVYFYSANDGQLLAKVTNNTSHDFGCTTLSVERDGDDAEGFFNGGNSASKAIRFQPEFSTSNADVDVTLYYSEGEISGFESATGEDREDLNVFNTSAADIDDADASNTTESVATYEDIKKTAATVIAGSFTANVTGALGGMVVASESSSQSSIAFEGDLLQNNLNASSFDLTIFPNPASERATIQLSLDEEQSIEINLMSINGQLIRKEMREYYPNQSIEMDLTTLNPGIYMVNIQTDTEQFTKRLIIE